METADVEEQRRAEEVREHLLVDEGGIRKDFVDRIQRLADSTSMSFASEAAKGYAPRFVLASKTALRVAFWTWLTGLGVWALRHSDSIPDVYVSALPGVVIAIIFNVTSNLATTVQSVIQSLVGTAFAIAVSWLLYHLPDPHVPGTAGPVAPPTCPAAPASDSTRLLAADDAVKDSLFEWFCVSSSNLVSADSMLPSPATIMASLIFSAFVVVTLSLNVVMPFKTFALVSGLTFMMNFANPAVGVTGSMDLTWESSLGVTVVTQVLGSAIAIAAMLLPPVTATQSSKALAARATKVTAELLLFITTYYCGSDKTIKINVYNSQLARNRADMATESKDLDSSWWEFFDWGSAGTARTLMHKHLAMLKDLDRRLAVMQLCVLREGFEQSHKDVMKDMKEPMVKVVRTVGECLMNCTLSAADGRFTEAELSSLAEQRKAIDDATEELANIWREKRGDIKNALSAGMRAESFFLVELSTVARMVADFTEYIVVPEKRPKPQNLAWAAMKNVVSAEKLKDKDFRNFILRNWISLTLAWCWAAVADNFSNAIPMNVVFMLTELPGNSLMMNLEKLEASVLGSLAGTVLYRAFHYCTLITKVMKLISLFLFEVLAMFTANYTKQYANVGLLLAVYGGGKLMMPCDEQTTNGEVSLLNSAEFKSLKFFAYAMCIVTVVDSMLKRESACTQAREKLLKALDVSLEYFRGYLNGKVKTGVDEIWEETNALTEEVDSLLDTVEGLLGACEQEPRFAKGPFKMSLFSELCTRIRNMTLNAQVLIRRSQGANDGLIDDLQKCANFQAVKKDLLHTMDDMQMIVKKIVSYDGFGAMSPSMFDSVIGKSGVDEVDALKQLKEDVIKSVDFSAPENEQSNSLEFGKVSRFAVVFELLELYVQDVAGMMKTAVMNM